jgi:imidazole glycerol-phosphate synthase subunit HisH
VNVGIIDYGGGNLRSVANALRSLGIEPRVVSSPDETDGLTHLLLPGQGAFGDVMMRLDDRGLTHLLREWIAADKPYFGICVGYQILFDQSEEAPGRSGLGVIPGTVRRFAAEPDLKVPHMGWNSALATRGETTVWNGLGPAPYFYYVHSYFPVPAHPHAIVAQTTYGTQTFAGAVERGRLFACQFHPEKSQTAGLRLIRNFIGSFG